MGRKYDIVFKEEAVKLSEEIGLADAANRLGVPYQTLSEWRKKRSPVRQQEAEGRTARERELEKEIAELKRTVEVLQEAIGFFARRPKK